MTARELSALIGTHVMMEPSKGLRFRCRVTNAKTSYGRPRVQIEAVDGQGQAWVNLETLKPCYPELAHRPDLASKESCYRCGGRIEDAEYLANDDNTVRHFACPEGGRRAH